jgi:hypothetical protein
LSESLNPHSDLLTAAAALNLPLEGLLTDIAKLSRSTVGQQEAYTPLRANPTSIRAALSESYSPNDLPDDEPTRELLGRSEIVMIGGRRRLRIADEARRELLRSVQRSPEFLRLLKEQTTRDKEQPSQIGSSEAELRSIWLRRFLSGDPSDLNVASPNDLRCAVAARERLAGLELPSNVLSLNEIRRLLDFSELLEPLRITIGAEGPWSEVPQADRFVGRTRELRILRSFVDEIKAEGRLEAVQRATTAVAQDAFAFFGQGKVPGVRFIVARGGLGKSALVAKFLLDHALKQRQRFPFAYLDFDRAAIQPRDPRQLLLEVSRQVAVQFPAVESEINSMRAGIRAALNDTSHSLLEESDPFDDFRQILRYKVTNGKRAMLLVLDTLEIVQRDSFAISGLLAFLERMSRGGFAELRIVAAGRADFPELMEGTPSRGSGESLSLEPLSVADAREMTQRLGKALFEEFWNDEWSKRVAGPSGDTTDRREPLSLRIAVETLRDTEVEKRDDKSREIEKLGEGASYSFVGKLYERRVLEHIADPRARRIAWPGLILRRVTVEIIRDLLAGPCQLDPKDSQAAFDSLSREVWIVSRRGDALWHLPDLRARTLPLMRLVRAPDSGDRPSVTFDTINTAAIQYFGARRNDSVNDYADWIYHRLLGGEAIEAIDHDWEKEIVSLLEGAEEDFPVGSIQADYLVARTSREILTVERFRRLPQRLALVHIARTGMQKGELVEASLDPILLELPLSTLSSSDDEGSSALEVLRIKCGFWSPIIQLGGLSVVTSWLERVDTAFAYYHARLLAGSQELSGVAPLEYKARVRETVTPASVHYIAHARIHALDWFANADAAFARFIGQRSSSADVGIALPMLRTAIVFGNTAALPTAQQWIGLFRERIRANQQIAFSSAEIAALVDEPSFARPLDGFLADFGLSSAELRDPILVHDNPTRFDNVGLVELVLNALLARCERGTPRDVIALKRFAAARDEDWLLPMAYAAHRGTRGTVPRDIGDLFEKHQPGTRSFVRRNILSRISVPKDVLHVLRLADEASDLSGALEIFAGASAGPESEDLRFLMSRRQDWRNQIGRIIDLPATLG